MKKALLFLLVASALSAQKVDWNRDIRNRPTVPHVPPYDYTTELSGQPTIPHAPPYNYTTELTGQPTIPHAPPYNYTTELSGQPTIPHAPPYDYTTELSNTPTIPFSIPGAFQFTRTPGGTLTSGISNTVTLSAGCPYGVNGTSIGPHYLYASAGTGTAEAVLITGGTCVSGASSGTVIFTPANNHSGAWTLTSATGGMQELLYYNQSVGGTVWLNAIYYAHAQCYIPASATAQGWKFMGHGNGVIASYARASDYTAGDLFLWDPTLVSSGNGSFTMQDFWIATAGFYGARVNVSSGAALHILKNGALPIAIDKMYFDSGYVGIDIDSSNFIKITNSRFEWGADYSALYDGLAAIRTRYTAGANSVTGIKITGNLISSPVATAAHPLKAGILVERSDGILIQGNDIGQLKCGIEIFAHLNTQIDALDIADNTLDSFQTPAVWIHGDAAPLVHNSIAIRNNHIATRYDIFPAYNTYGILVDNNSYLEKLQIVGNRIILNGLSGVAFGNTNSLAKEVIIAGNEIYDNDLSGSGVAGVLFSANVANAHIEGNQIYNSALGGAQAYAIQAQVLTDSSILGNNFRIVSGSTAQAPITFTGLTRTLIHNNAGLDDVIGTVASGASVTIPINPNFTITGTTGVGTVVGTNLSIGSTGLVYTPDGTVTFTAGASIGNTFTTVQNAPHSWIWNGTKFYIH